MFLRFASMTQGIESRNIEFLYKEKLLFKRKNIYTCAYVLPSE